MSPDNPELVPLFLKHIYRVSPGKGSRFDQPLPNGGLTPRSITLAIIRFLAIQGSCLQRNCVERTICSMNVLVL